MKLKNATEINFNNGEEFFAQEFLENPLLVNGHSFDFGIYVVITSVSPLRLYYCTKNVIMRFCPKPYDTSNPDDVDRYVVSETRTPVWSFDGTKKYFDNGYGTKDAFEGVVKLMGGKVDEVWAKIEDCIRSIVVSKESEFIKWVRKLLTILS